MWFLAQGNRLLHHVHASKNQSTSKRDQRPKSLEGLGNLGRKFSCRSQHKGKEGLRFFEKGL
jgi:hypothetical protein